MPLASFTAVAWPFCAYSDVFVMNSASTVLPMPVSEYALGQYQLCPMSLLRFGVIGVPLYSLPTSQLLSASTWMMITFLPAYLPDGNDTIRGPAFAWRMLSICCSTA